MFKEILSVPGKSGLFKLVSQTPKMIIVEALTDKKRMPVYPHEKAIKISDIAMYSTGEESEIRLHKLLTKAFELENGAKIAIDAKSADAEVLREYFGKVLPDFDREKVHTSDIKKFILWYNVLIDAEITVFEGEEEDDEKPLEQQPEKKVENKPKAVKQSAPKVATKSSAAKQSTRVAVKKGS
jgi:hypothetical protein